MLFWHGSCNKKGKTTGKEEMTMKTMKTLLKKFETAMVAAAFAEEGEFETARQIM